MPTPTERYNALVERGRKSPEYPLLMAKDRIADEISVLMQDAGLTKSEFARRLGCSRQRVTHILLGENLTIESLVKIGQALNCQLAESIFISSSLAPQSEQNEK